MQRQIDINMVKASGTHGYVINGGAAASKLEGSNFSDSITGNARADTLIGNRGNDTFVGGTVLTYLCLEGEQHDSRCW